MPYYKKKISISSLKKKCWHLLKISQNKF